MRRERAGGRAARRAARAGLALVALATVLPGCGVSLFSHTRSQADTERVERLERRVDVIEGRLAEGDAAKAR